jgi:SEC-C motif
MQMVRRPQCIANAANAQHSTGPKTEQGKSTVAKNGVQHGLFAAYERLAPADAARITQFIEELSDGFQIQSAAFADVIRQYAIAKWRSELFYRMEASVLESAIADERASPESAALIEEYGEDILFGHAIRHDAAGPNAFTKLMRYESRVMKELGRARDSYYKLLEILAGENAKPISGPKAVNTHPAPPETPSQTPRNAPCPCGSGIKFKRCCGIESPAMLH